jgi:hypothetical protein
MKTFWLSAALGDASITTMVKSDLMDELIADWDLAARKVIKLVPSTGKDGIAGTSRNFVIDNMLAGRHHTDPDSGKMVCAALLWLTTNGPLGEQLTPFLRRGGPNVSVHVEISRVKGERPLYNFRTKIDDETSKQLVL